MTTAARKHRMQTRLDDQAEHITRLEQTIAQLSDENADLHDQRASADRAVTASELRGMHTATQLAEARDRVERLQGAAARIDAHYAVALADKDRQIADLQRRLDVGVKAKAAADQTQPIDTDTVRLHVARVQHLSALNPRADTVQLPITDPAHLPGGQPLPQEVA